MLAHARGYSQYYFQKLMQSGSTFTGMISGKTAWYIAWVAIFEYLQIPQEQLSILAILMVVDFLTGIAKQYRINPQGIESHKAWIGIVKKICTIILIFSVALVIRGIGFEPQSYILIILSLLIVAEWYSIVQNIYSVHTGNRLSEYDAISAVIGWIWNFFIGIIETLLEKLKTPKP